MALPGQLKTARMTNDTLGLDIDNKVGELEGVLCDVFGFTIDTNITESPLSCDNDGRITKALLRQKAAAPIGWRFRDSTTGKEFCIQNNTYEGNNYLNIGINTGTEDVPLWTNYLYLNHGDGVWTFVNIPEGPGDDPTAANQFTRKGYVDAKIASEIDASVGSRAILQDQKDNGTNGGIAVVDAWTASDLNTIVSDLQSIVTSVADNRFTLPAGTYHIRATRPVEGTLMTRAALYNFTDSAYAAYGPNANVPYVNGAYISAGVATLDAIVTIAGAKAFEIRYKVSSNGTGSAQSLGKANSWGTKEIYTEVEIIKLA